MYASNSWAPYQPQWSMDKHEFLDKFNEQQPSPETFDLVISKYAEVANQISSQTDDDSRLAIRYVQFNVSALRNSLIRHLDEWQRLHMDLLARRSFEKLDEILVEIEKMSKEIEFVPTNRKEMVETLQLHERIMQVEVQRMEASFVNARNHFRVMGENI